MALKDIWVDLENAIPGVAGSGSDVLADDINNIANAVIDIENTIENDVDAEMSDTSENAVQNKVIKAYVDNQKNYYISVDYNEEEAEVNFRSTFEEIFEIFDTTSKNLVVKFVISSNSSQSENTTYYIPLKSYEYANNDTFIFESVIQAINKNVVITCSRLDGWSLIYEDIPYVEKSYVDGLVGDIETLLGGI